MTTKNKENEPTYHMAERKKHFQFLQRDAIR